MIEKHQNSGAVQPSAGFQEKVEGEPETWWQQSSAPALGFGCLPGAQDNKILNTHVILNSEGEMVSVYRSLVCTCRGTVVWHLAGGLL